jgi:hypothetical protein
MITKLQLKFIETCQRNPDGTPVRTVKYQIYYKRIQKHINEMLEIADVLAEKYPEVLLDKEREYSDTSGKIKSNRRMRKLLQLVSRLTPNMDLHLTLKKAMKELEEAPET